MEIKKELIIAKLQQTFNLSNDTSEKFELVAELASEACTKNVSMSKSQFDEHVDRAMLEETTNTIISKSIANAKDLSMLADIDSLHQIMRLSRALGCSTAIFSSNTLNRILYDEQHLHLVKTSISALGSVNVEKLAKYSIDEDVHIDVCVNRLTKWDDVAVYLIGDIDETLLTTSDSTEDNKRTISVDMQLPISYKLILK